MNSLWQHTAAMPHFPHLEGDAKTDVLVIGGGMAGLLTADALTNSGVQTLLIEADKICRGVTANTTAKITSQHGLIYSKILHRLGPEQARMYYDANQKALEQYCILSRDIPCDFETRDNYIYSIHHPEKLDQELTALEKLHIPSRHTHSISIPVQAAGAICFPSQAQFHPLKFAAGLCTRLNIREHTRAVAIEGNTVITNHGRIHAEKIVIATHFPIINKHGSYFLKQYQNRSYVLALENGPSLDGMYLDEAGDGLSFRNYGDLLLLGGGSHRTGKQGSAWSELERFSTLHYPAATEKYRWATQDCMTLDTIPYVGRYSARTPNLYVATGFNKWGMTGSMVSSMVLTDLIQGKETPYAPLFSPSRQMAIPQLLSNAFSSAVNLLTPTRPRCPHMGCALKWNPQERSWDCPCHGSRFAPDGTLLDNPATDDLDVE